ncbi:MAG TPA: chaperone modulator CbpM [Rhodocyclaceae bacterium]|nr:chaperone modulator CbpM [Rhodocyclaceae bacterium]
MTRQDVLTGMLLEEAALTLEELARACRADPAWVVARVELGVLTCATTRPAPRFSDRDLQRARRILALERTFDADPELAAMFADLVDEVERLRGRLRRAGLDAD